MHNTPSDRSSQQAEQDRAAQSRAGARHHSEADNGNRTAHTQGTASDVAPDVPRPTPLLTPYGGRSAGRRVPAPGNVKRLRGRFHNLVSMPL